MEDINISESIDFIIENIDILPFPFALLMVNSLKGMLERFGDENV